jgi:hypothetical protein
VFGAGKPGHLTRGDVLPPPYHQLNYRDQNFPHSRQSLVFGLNNEDITVGTYSTQNLPAGDNQFAFYAVQGKHYHKGSYRTKHPFSPPVDQLLGVNDQGLAVGFYVDSGANTHGSLYNIRTHKYRIVRTGMAGVTSVTATAINNADSVVGFYTDSAGQTRGFLVRKTAPHLIKLNFPGSVGTLPFGVSQHGEVVGTYEDNSTGTIVQHGFTWTRRHGFHAVDDPHGTGGTEISGVNSAGDLVGWYVGPQGHTNGFLARPQK